MIKEEKQLIKINKKVSDGNEQESGIVDDRKYVIVQESGSESDLSSSKEDEMIFQ